MRRFELSEGGSNKFWEIGVEGTGTTVCFGRLGTKGQVQQKSFASPDAAEAAAAKLVAEKVAKGYVEVAPGAGAAEAPRAAPPKESPAPKAAPPKETTAPKAARGEKLPDDAKKRLDRVVRKAKAAETSPWDILDLALDGDAPEAPRAAAEMLLGLFAKGRLGTEHTDALDALGYLLHDAPNVRRLTASPKRSTDAYAPIPLELVDVDLVARLLAGTTASPWGMEALALVAHRRDASKLLAARASFGEAGRALLDAARLRAGEALAPEDRDAAVALLVRARVPLLADASGHVAVVTHGDVERACAAVPQHVFTAAWTEHFAGRGGYDARRLVELFEAKRLDDDALVRIALSPQNHLNDETTLAAFLRLEVRAATLFAALARWREACPWQFGKENDAARTLLACLGARAAAREGAAIPEAFEVHVGPIEHGLPGHANQHGLAGVAAFVLETLQLLPRARAAALSASLLARSEERVALGRHAYFDSDALLAAIASGDADAIARASVRLGTLPRGVQALAGVAPAPAPAPTPAAAVAAAPAPAPRVIDPATRDAALAGEVVATLDVTSGELVVTDAGTLDSRVRVRVADGRYAIRVASAPGRLTALAVVRDGASPTTFAETGAFGVDTGTAGVFDAEVLAAVSDHVFDENVYEDLVGPALETRAHATLALEDASFFACRSGHGDGAYPVFAGTDDHGAVVAILVTF